MQKVLEICCSDIDSVHLAIEGGADRIELCSALSEGGLTPSAGLISEAVKCGITVNTLIRPRGGDFVYNKAETKIMLSDITTAASLGVNGVVIGALCPNGTIDIDVCTALINQAKKLNLDVTYHRAFDLCSNPESALESIIQLGANRLLTSGLAATALDGAKKIRRLCEIADGRIKIMAGCGVTPRNITEIIDKTGVTEIHASAKTLVKSPMEYINPNAKMGSVDDYSRIVTSRETVQELATIVHSYYEKA